MINYTYTLLINNFKYYIQILKWEYLLNLFYLEIW